MIKSPRDYRFHNPRWRANRHTGSPPPNPLNKKPEVDWAKLPSTATSLKSAALQYAQMGIYIRANHGITEKGRCTCNRPECERWGKHPAKDSGLAHNEKIGEGTISQEIIETWWAMIPDANIAIVCGLKSDLVVVDVDEKNGGYDSLEKLFRSHEDFTDTAIAQSGGGGVHFYFKHPGGVIRNRIGLYPGIDIRGDNGKIVAPPSRHKSGNIYEWKEGYGIKEKALARVPQWLLNAIQFEKGTGTRLGRI